MKTKDGVSPLSEKIKNKVFPRVCNCKRILFEKDAEYIGENELNEKRAYWFNCLHCETTFIKINKK